VSPAEQAQTFAGALLGDHGEMLNGLQLTLSTFTSGAPGPRTRWIPATVDSLASSVLRDAPSDTTMGVYVGVGLTRGTRAIDPATGKRYRRLAKDDVDALVWLWADIDIAGAAHGYRLPLVPDQATAIALARSTGLAPTVLVDTGHGIQAHWRLAEPFIYGLVDFDDDGVPIIDPTRVEADRKAGEVLAWTWVKSLQIRAKIAGEEFVRGGWHVDPTTDPSRLVRCPGSWNRKVEGDHRLVRVLEVDSARRYAREDFEAMFMPEKLLAPYRFDTDILTGALAGVDLAALWNAARTFPNHEPPWLLNIFDLGVAPELEALWRGDRDAEWGNDDSSIDAALARALLKWRLSAADAAQAIMCRRLRRCEPGKKLDKVDPTIRQTYLTRTLGAVAASVTAEETAAARHLEVLESEALAATPTPLQLVTNSPVPETNNPDSVPGDLQLEPDFGAGDPGPDEPPPDDSHLIDEPPTDVAPEDATYNENAVSLDPPAAEPDEPSSPPSLRAAPEPDPPDLTEGAPTAPRLGIDDSTPGGPTEEERPKYARLAAELGLPAGEVWIHAVGERRLADRNEIRVWLKRKETSAVRGGRWRVGEVAATRWHPIDAWMARTRVVDVFMVDLHLEVDVSKKWRFGRDGMGLLFEVAREMPAGTPEALVELAVKGLLGPVTGTAHWATAVTSRDPWVADEDAIWVPLVNLLGAYKALGHKAMDANDFLDVLALLRCKVQAGMEETDAGISVYDAAQWVRVPQELIGLKLWMQTATRAIDRDAQDKRNGIRVLGP
jgi:hypothetical protein